MGTHRHRHINTQTQKHIHIYRHTHTHQAWWYMMVIIAPRRLRQENHKFESRLGYINSVSRRNTQLVLLFMARH